MPTVTKRRSSFGYTVFEMLIELGSYTCIYLYIIENKLLKKIDSAPIEKPLHWLIHFLFQQKKTKNKKNITANKYIFTKQTHNPRLATQPFLAGTAIKQKTEIDIVLSVHRSA